MPAHGTNPMFLNKKYKDWTSSTLATPPLRPITSHFCLTLPTFPPQSGRRMCITPNFVCPKR